MKHLTCGKYETAQRRLFQIVNLTKDELMRRDRIDYSMLVFVLEGKVCVTTAVCVSENVESGYMFVVHEKDYVGLRGVEETTLLFCYFDSSMALSNGLSLKPATKELPPPTHTIFESAE